MRRGDAYGIHVTKNMRVRGWEKNSGEHRWEPVLEEGARVRVVWPRVFSKLFTHRLPACL